jgi:hypothetical protein
MHAMDEIRTHFDRKDCMEDLDIGGRINLQLLKKRGMRVIVNTVMNFRVS